VATSTDILRILLTGDSRGLVEAFKSAQGAAEKMSVAGGALTRGVTLPLVGLGVAAVGFASDLDAAGSKVDQVFGSSADEVQAFAETTTDAFGISERAALQAAGTFGNLFTAIGLGEDAATDMSLELIELAADLSAFHDVAREDVLAKLQSGLVGEIEPLRSLGVSFNAAQVDAAAMAVAIADGRDAITEADKVAGRYNLILEQTATAQGQAGREADTLAGQQARASAEMEDAAAAIGQELLPAVADATGMIADLANWFGDLPQPVQSTAVKIGVFAAALGPAVLIGGKLATTLTSLKASLVGLGAGRAGAAGGAAAGLGLVVLALYQAEQRAETARRKFEELSAAMSEGFQNSALQGELQSWELTLDQLGTSSDEVGRALTGGEEAWQSFIDSFIDRQDGPDQAAAALYGLNVVVETYREQIEDATAAQETRIATMERERRALADEYAASEKATEAMSSYEGVHRAAADTIANLNRETLDYLGILDQIQGATMNTTDAQIAVFDAIDSVSQAIKDNGPVLDLATEAGRRNTEEVQNLAESYVDYAQALEDAKAPQEEVNNALSYGRESVRGVLEQFGVAPQFIDPYLDALGLIPPTIETEIILQRPFPPKVKEIGRQISEGVALGVSEGASSVLNAVGGMISSAVDHAKNVAGIRSPSALFAEKVGGPISEGVAQGILDALDAPQSAIDTLFDELVSRANEGISSVLGAASAGFGTGSAQDRVTRAEQAVAGAKTPEEKARAERDLLEAQLGLVSATQQMIEAGQELLGQGAEGEALFRRVAGQAGLTMTEIDRLVAQARNSANIAEGYLPGDVSGLIGSGEGNPAVQQNITINMPPGSNGADVVAALVSYQRQNGPIPISVSG
jgi:hypothetical protein